MNKVKGKRGKSAEAKKPSIKITVSADIPENLHTSPAPSPSPQAIVKKIVSFSGDDVKDNEETVMRITVDDSVVDFPNCIDFGIKDFLCCKDEIDLEMSSDTDTSFLEATPPHRFSDSELEGQIEIMSITLDNVLKNLGPKRPSLNSTFSKDDLFTFDLRVSNEDARILRNRNASDDESDKQRFRTTIANNGRQMPPPPRPFRRHISLPASIFMTYLMEHNIANKSKQHNGEDTDGEESLLISNVVEPLLRNNQEPLQTARNNGRFVSRKLTKIDGSCSSSVESHEDEISQHNYTNDVENSSMTSGSSRGTPVYQNNSNSNYSNSDTQSIGELDGEDPADAQQAFTSDIERQSLVLRYMRKLVRQDTYTGNFAPPDYCI